MDGEDQRRLEIKASIRLVFVAHHQHGKLRRLPRLLVELLLDALLVGQYADHAVLVRDRIDQKVALPVDGAEAAVLDLEQIIGHPRRFAGVAKISAQHLQILLVRQRLVAPEQAFHLAPREEVGVDDLVGIAAQQKVAGLL